LRQAVIPSRQQPRAIRRVEVELHGADLRPMDLNVRAFVVDLTNDISSGHAL
jgi:hypothetical protein